MFKKVTHAFSVLSDTEKKAFYDKYGDENEARERFTKTYHRRYDEDDNEVFNIFNLFFGGEDIFGRNINLHQRMHQQQNKNNNGQNQQHQNNPNGPRIVRNNPWQLLFQLLPLIFLALFSILPYFLNSVIS